MIRYGFILTIICMVAAGLLAGVNSLTRVRIIAAAQAEEEASLKEVLPEAARFEAVKSGDAILYYQALDKNEKPVGVAFKTAGQGYSSTIETMVGMLEDGTITTIKVLSHNETPGLGARVAEPDFTRQFSRVKANDLAGVQAITGATISSKAVMDAVKKKAAEVSVLLIDKDK